MCNSWTTPIFYSSAYLIPSSWTSTIPIFHERVITISKKKSKGNRPAAPNPREDIHGNLFDYEEFMNSLWTAYEQFMNNNTFCNMFAGGGVTGVASLPSASFNFNLSFRCFPLIRRCRSVVFLSGLPAKPRLCWIMNNAWAVHEQFMNNVGLAFLANTWHESFGKWYLIVCARTCLRDWKKHSQRLLKKIHEQVALHSLRRNRLRDCLKTWPA